MANKIPLVIADVELQLASKITAGDTSFTLSSANDDDGNALPAGKYCFTVNNGSSQKEYLLGQLNGTEVTSVVSVSRQGVETSGAARTHRVGTSAIVTNFAALQRVADILRGQETLDADNPIYYDAEPTLSNREELATVAYVLDNVNGGTVSFDNQIISSSDATAGETIAAGDWVFFQTSDQEWYQADADVAAEVENVQLGVALGAGSDGASISGGVQIAGVYTTSGLTAGDTYYISNTVGEITNSAGTNSMAVGIALSTTKLLLSLNRVNSPTTDQKSALDAAASPSATNKFLTEDDIADYSVFAPIQVVTFTSSGTWTKDAGLKYIVVEGVGAGATSNNTNSGGGGGYFRKLILASALGATETVTVGVTGSPGGNTSFGSHATGNGGARTTGGTATGGDLNIKGGNGTNSGSGGTGGNYGMGGHSMLGFAATDGDSAGGYGAGAAGDNGGSANTNGTNGIVIVTEYYV